MEKDITPLEGRTTRQKALQKYVWTIADNIAPESFVSLTENPQLELFPHTNKSLMSILKMKFLEFVDDELFDRLLDVRDGDLSKIMGYLYLNNTALGNISPIELLERDEAEDTHTGRDAVLKQIGQIEYGIFA